MVYYFIHACFRMTHTTTDANGFILLYYNYIDPSTLYVPKRNMYGSKMQHDALVLAGVGRSHALIEAR